jgi:formate hydrogenlyase transcriptional activator
MPEQVTLSKRSLSLRERAETALRASRTDVAQMSAEEIKKLVHELQLHQIELELQNEELRHLYDFAPVGYLTLDHDATVLQANLTAASVLAAERQKLIGRKFTHFVAPNSLDAFYLHHQAALESGTKQICDLLLRRADGNLFPAQIETIYAEDPSTRARHCRSTISDITERRKAEQALAGSHAELERRIIERTAELALNNERLKAEIVERAQVEQAARQSEARFHAIFHQAIVGVAQNRSG